MFSLPFFVYYMGACLRHGLKVGTPQIVYIQMSLPGSSAKGLNPKGSSLVSPTQDAHGLTLLMLNW